MTACKEWNGSGCDTQKLGWLAHFVVSALAPYKCSLGFDSLCWHKMVCGHQIGQGGFSPGTQVSAHSITTETHLSVASVEIFCILI